MGSLYVVINAITDDIKLYNVASCSVKSLYIVILCKNQDCMQLLQNMRIVQ